MSTPPYQKGKSSTSLTLRSMTLVPFAVSTVFSMPSNTYILIYLPQQLREFDSSQPGSILQYLVLQGSACELTHWCNIISLLSLYIIGSNTELFVGWNYEYRLISMLMRQFINPLFQEILIILNTPHTVFIIHTCMFCKRYLSIEKCNYRHVYNN